MKKLITLFFLFFFQYVVVAQMQGDSLGGDIENQQKVKYKFSKKKDSKKKKKLKKKENPAYRILSKVWENKRTNGLKTFDAYEYESYQKLQVDLTKIDSSFFDKKLFKGFEFLGDKMEVSDITGEPYLPFYLNESIKNVYGINRPQSKTKTEVVASKSAGINSNGIVTNILENVFGDYDIYDNNIEFFDKLFVSPVSRSGFSTYDYKLRDSIEIEGHKHYRIRFKPKQETSNAFKGEMLIADKVFAITDISFRSAKKINVNFVDEIYVDLSFDLIGDNAYIPTKEYVFVDLALSKNKEKGMGGMYAHKMLSYKNFKFDSPYESNFYKAPLPPTKEEVTKTDEYWEKARHVSLNEEEKGIYTTIEQVQKVPRFKKIQAAVDLFGTGWINVKNKVDVGNLYSVVSYNVVEGFKPRISARTFKSENDKWRLQGYGAFGFRDQRFKYNLETRGLLDQKSRWVVGASVLDDIIPLNTNLGLDQNLIRSNGGVLSLIQSNNNFLLTEDKSATLFSSIEPIRNVTLGVKSKFNHIASSNEKFSIDYIQDGQVQDEFKDLSLEVSLTARPGTRYSRYGVDRFEHSDNYPDIGLSYSKSITGAWGSNLDYSKLRFYYNQDVLVPFLGNLEASVIATKIFGEVPLPLLITYNEFTADQNLSLSLENHFNGRIINRIPLVRRSKLRSVAFIRAAKGSISDKNIEINRSSIKYIAPENDFFYEYGVGLENIGLGNFRFFRVDFAWRGNYFDAGDLNGVQVNPFVVRLGLNVGF